MESGLTYLIHNLLSRGFFCLGSPVLLRGGNVTSQSRCTSRVRTTRGHGCLASDGSKWFRFDLTDHIGNEMPKEAFKPPLQGICGPRSVWTFWFRSLVRVTVM